MGQHGHGCGGHHPPGVPDVLHDQHWGLILSPSLPILFLFFTNKENLVEQMGIRMLEVMTSAVKQNLPSNQLFLVLRSLPKTWRQTRRWSCRTSSSGSAEECVARERPPRREHNQLNSMIKKHQVTLPQYSCLLYVSFDTCFS